MKNLTLKLLSLVVLAVAFTSISGCQEKKTALLKIHLKTGESDPIPEMDVILIADQYSTPKYDDEAITNEEGYALFNLDMHFKTYGKEVKAGDFKIYIRLNGISYLGTVRARENTTTEETFYVK